MGTTVRFWSTNIGFALIQNISYTLNQKHFIQIEQHLNMSNPITVTYWSALVEKYLGTSSDQLATNLASKSLQATLSQQASLISNMEIFTYLGILGAFITLIIFLFTPAKAMFMRLRIPYL